jgi:plasmid maintenance system antidote protein VapI
MPNTEDERSLHERMDDIERLLSEPHPEEALLVEKIEQFGFSADELAKALLLVERSQRELVLLKRRVTTAEAEKADKSMVSQDMQEAQKEHRHEISRVRSFAYSAAVLAIGLLGATVFAFTMYAKVKDDANVRYADSVQRVCEQRSDQSRIIGQYLTDQLKQIEDNPGIPADQKALAKKQAATLRKAFPDIDCSKLTYR